MQTALIDLAFHSRDCWDAETRAMFERDVNAQRIEWRTDDGQHIARIETDAPGALFDWLLQEGFQGFVMWPVEHTN